jgi:hypothetical protein
MSGEAPPDAHQLLTDLNDHLRASAIDAQVSLPTKRMGEFQSIDPATIQLVVSLAGTAAAGAAVSGVFSALVECIRSRQLSRRIKVQVGDRSIELSADSTPESIKTYVDVLTQSS